MKDDQVSNLPAHSKESGVVDTDVQFQLASWYHASEAPRLFDALVEGSVRFEFETSDDFISGQSAIRSRFGGGFGQGAYVLVWVHPADQNLFNAIQRKVFPPRQ